MIQFIQLKQITSGLPPKKNLRYCLNADAEALLHKVKFEDKKIWLIVNKPSACSVLLWAY